MSNKQKRYDLMTLELYRINELDENLKDKIDNFILDNDTTGEFINSLDYLSYHGNRFTEDSVVVFDMPSRNIKGVLLMCVVDERTVVSHLGTTFAGPIINLKTTYQELNDILDLMLGYYEKKYREIILKILPYYYAKQPIGVLEYLLMRRGYTYGMSALANVISLKNIQTEEDLFKTYTSNRRNKVRRAIKSKKFVFKKCNEISEEIWEHMNTVLKKRFNAHTTHSYSEIIELHKRVPNQIIPYEVRTTDGEYASFALVYKFKNVFHTQYLDMNYEFSGEYPNYLLIHSLIQDAVLNKFSIFSLGASTEQMGEYLNEGLYTYKNRYGGGSIILPVYRKTMN